MPQTNRLTLTLTVDLIASIKERAMELFGKRKGAISHYVEMVMRNDLHLGHEDMGVETE